MEVLTELKDADHTSPQYPGLVRQITANFDDFKDNGTVWGRGGAKVITRKDKDDHFIGYTYKRKKVILKKNVDTFIVMFRYVLLRLVAFNGVICLLILINLITLNLQL